MKRFKVFVLLIALLGAFTLILSGCGGGGGGTSSTSSTLSGTVATGKPLAYATVYLKDINSNTRSVITDANGNFSIDTTGLTPPFYLKVQGYNLYSYTDQKSGTANITPLTNAVVAIANGGDPNIYDNPKPLNIASAKNMLLQEAGAGVGLVMQKYGVPPDADPISTPFVANGVGMDAVLDSIVITVHTDTKNIEIKNPFTNTKIGEITFTGGTPTVDPVNQTEVNSLPQTVTHKKYFASVVDDYGSPEYGPIMVDIVDDGNGKLSVTLTAINGDTGDPFLIYGNGTKSGNNITFTVHVIMCSDTDHTQTGEKANAVFTGTINNDGTITGTFTNTLPPGDTCEENGSDVYEGNFIAYDVTNATPVNISGTYNAYATPEGWDERGPVTLKITQDSQDPKKVTNVTLMVDGNSYTGTGIVYGSYVMFTIPIIICDDTNANAVAENAIFYGKFENGTITGIYGDGIPSGDYCKATDYDQTGNTTSATGTWRAEQ